MSICSSFNQLFFLLISYIDISFFFSSQATEHNNNNMLTMPRLLLRWALVPCRVRVRPIPTLELGLNMDTTHGQPATIHSNSERQSFSVKPGFAGASRSY